MWSPVVEVSHPLSHDPRRCRSFRTISQSGTHDALCRSAARRTHSPGTAHRRLEHRETIAVTASWTAAIDGVTVVDDKPLGLIAGHLTSASWPGVRSTIRNRPAFLPKSLWVIR